jgi:hypothetical protein
MEAMLGLVAGRVAIVFLEPVANRAIQNGRDGNALKPGLALQVRFELAG